MRKIYLTTLISSIITISVSAQNQVLQLRPHIAYGYRFTTEQYANTNSKVNTYEFNRLGMTNTEYWYDNILDYATMNIQAGLSLEYRFNRRHILGVTAARSAFGDYGLKANYRDVVVANNDTSYYSEFRNHFLKYTIDYTYNFYLSDFVSTQNFLNRIYFGIGLNIGGAKVYNQLYGQNRNFDTTYYNILKPTSLIIEPNFRIGFLSKDKTRERVSFSISYEMGSRRMMDEGRSTSYYSPQGQLIESKAGQISGINQIRWNISMPITLYDFRKKRVKKESWF